MSSVSCSHNGASLLQLGGCCISRASSPASLLSLSSLVSVSPCTDAKGNKSGSTCSPDWEDAALNANNILNTEII